MTSPPPPAGPGTSPPAAPLDRPALPAVRRSWLMRLYLALSVLVLTGFALAGVLGWELRDGTSDRAPGSARQSPGGYRSYHFWHVGYHGGK